MENQELKFSDVYLDTPVKQLYDNGQIEKTVLRACFAAKPPMLTAGDVVKHLREKGSFSDVPGCRRPGRITVALMELSHHVIHTNTPMKRRPLRIKRSEGERLAEMAEFNFMTDDQRIQALTFRGQYDYLPMFTILNYYLNRDDASRDDKVMAFFLGMTPGDIEEETQSRHTLAEIGSEVNLSRERVRQIALNYTLPEMLTHPILWKGYADHSAYYIDSTDPVYQRAAEKEVPGLSFAAYAAILHRTTMLQNMEDRFMARRGWTTEIAAWVKRLSKLAQMPRTSEGQVSIQGLAQGGQLDARIRLVVLNQIAPALGLKASAPDTLILPVNVED